LSHILVNNEAIRAGEKLFLLRIRYFTFVNNWKSNNQDNCSLLLEFPFKLDFLGNMVDGNTLLIFFFYMNRIWVTKHTKREKEINQNWMINIILIERNIRENST